MLSNTSRLAMSTPYVARLRSKVPRRRDVNLHQRQEVIMRLIYLRILSRVNTTKSMLSPQHHLELRFPQTSYLDTEDTQIRGYRVFSTSSNQRFLRSEDVRRHQPTLGYSHDTQPDYSIELPIGHAEKSMGRHACGCSRGAIRDRIPPKRIYP
jgi:hypothetical protein